MFYADKKASKKLLETVISSFSFAQIEFLATQNLNFLKNAILLEYELRRKDKSI